MSHTVKAFEITQANLEARNIVADCATMEARMEAYRNRQPSENPSLLFPEGQTLSSAHGSIPEVCPEDFNVDSLRQAVTEHGALIVRGFFSTASMDTLVTAANYLIDACAGAAAGENTAANIYHNPPEHLKTIMPNGSRELGNTRSFHRESGSAMCIEAPSIAESLLLLYEAYGLKEILTEYLQEPPCLTVKKWVLRRSRLPVAEAGWHQDGAFMGTAINSINMWVPLTDCGGQTGAPGMDVVPRRLTGLASTEGAQFEWSVSDSLAQGHNSEQQPIAPVFKAGDAFFFDHFYLHRTQFRTDFTKLRYALETWFFGASCFPKNQVPLAW